MKAAPEPERPKLWESNLRRTTCRGRIEGDRDGNAAAPDHMHRASDLPHQSINQPIAERSFARTGHASPVVRYDDLNNACVAPPPS